MEFVPILPVLIKKNLDELEIRQQDYFAVGFSGGPDSVFLAYMLFQLGYRNVYLIYINYHDSDNVDIEEKIVRDFASTYNYRLKVFNVDFNKAPKKINFEKMAREIRYVYFASFCKMNFLKGVLVAHHQDDLICTYLAQKMKGGPVSYFGLSKKIKILGNNVYRPLLNVKKEDIISFLKSSNIEYYDDKTNYNLLRERNFIRETVLPYVNREGVLKEIDENNKLLEPLKKYMNSPIIDFKTYSSLSENYQKALIYFYLEGVVGPLQTKDKLRFRNLIFEDMKNLKVTSRIKLDEHIYFFKDYKYSYVILTINEFKPYSFEISEPIYFSHGLIGIDLTHFEEFNLKKSDFPLFLTNAKKDMEFNTNIKQKSVWEFLKKHKVPIYLRDIYPVLTNKEGKALFVPFYDKLVNKEYRLKFLEHFILKI